MERQLHKNWLCERERKRYGACSEPPWITTSLASYSNCGNMYYQVETRNLNGTLVDTNVTNKIIDSSGTTVYQQNVSAGMEDGNLPRNYTLVYNALTGSWSVHAVTCERSGMEFRSELELRETG